MAIRLHALAGRADKILGQYLISNSLAVDDILQLLKQILAASMSVEVLIVFQNTEGLSRGL